MRFIVFHYHIFKNAGSTVDHMLQDTFGDKWAAFEGGLATSKIFPEQISDFIVNNPTVAAISSHHAQLPLPNLPDVEIFPIVFMRHPLDRVRSIYDFERKQGMRNPVSKGAEHAARLSFVDYLQWRFGTARNNVVCNSQMLWLLHDKKFQKEEIAETNFERAWEQLKALKFFGLVEAFQPSVELLARDLKQHGVQFDTEYKVVNSNNDRHESMEQRLEVLRENLGEATWTELQDRNRWDLLLYERATQEFNRRVEELL